MSPADRRPVRVTPAFFDRLDALLPPERTAAGLPSATAFLLHEMAQVVDRLAEEYDDVTLPVTDMPGVRVLVAAGFLVPQLAVYAVRAADGGVDIIYLDIDRPRAGPR